MIELGYSRERMLADLGLDAPPRPGVVEPEALRLLEGERAHVLGRGHAPPDLFPPLEEGLGRRFADRPADELHRSLLSPLKKALGNAHKRGNRRDPEKWIEVEVLASERGALVRVSDEGPGFDVPGTLARFRAGEPYFAHHGSGFRRYAKARSIISFADGGSTWLLCYRVGRPARAPTR